MQTCMHGWMDEHLHTYKRHMRDLCVSDGAGPVGTLMHSPCEDNDAGNMEKDEGRASDL